jgi:hypothetical protein
LSPHAAVPRALLAFVIGAILPAFSETAFAQTAPPADGRGPDGRRGPIEIYDDHVLAQARLTLPAASPFTIPPGTWSVDVSVLWSNSFSWTQDVAGEEPADRRFLMDGETLTLAATLRRGVGRHVDLGLRILLQHRGGGTLDPFIDVWHRIFRLNDAARPSFLRNAFRVEGLTTAGDRFEWVDATGTALGDVEVNGRWRLIDGGDDSASAALVGRLSLPTATAPYAGTGLGGGAQIVVARPVGRTTDVYLGAGFTVQDPGPVRGLEYERVRGQGFAAFEWRPWRPVSLIAETSIATRLVKNIDSYPGTHWLVNLEARIDLAERWRLDLGLTENLIDQQSTTDLGLYFGVGWRQ